MTRIVKKALAFLAIAVSFCAAASAFADDFLYPMQYPKAITATFGEYRIGHAHAGLDFSTGLQNGRLVIAADDGDIIRLKAGYHGYGQVIYQRTPSGKILVYAHLAGFAPKLDKYAQEIRESSGRYSFNRFFSPGQIKVKRGEHIGYSGDTGTDVPHLHFEVRDSSNVTVNPLLNGLTIEDTQPPAIQKLHVEPLNYDAHVNGSWHEKIFTFKKGGDGNYTLDEPIRIGGKVGLAVQVTDYCDGSPRLLNPYEIEFQINGVRKFLIRYDRFDYGMKAISELDYNYRLKEQRLGAFHRLYRLYDRIIFHPEDLTGNLGGLEPRQYIATIISTDANGNRSEARFRLNVNLPPKVQEVTFTPQADQLSIQAKAVDPDGQVTRVTVERKTKGDDWEKLLAPALGKGVFEAGIPAPTESSTTFRIVAVDDSGDKSTEYTTAYAPKAPTRPNGEVSAQPKFNLRGRTISLLLLRSAGFSHSPEMTVTLDPAPKSGPAALDTTLYQTPTAVRINAEIPPNWEGGVVRFEGIFLSAQGVPYSGRWEMPLLMVGKKGGIITSADGVARAVFPERGSYTSLPLRVEKKSVRAPSWLEPVSEGYRFGKKWEPMRKMVRVSIQIPENTPRLHQVGMYLYDRGVWWYVGNDRDANNLSARVAHMGTFALMRDVSPPDIGDISPSGVVDDLKPTIEVKVTDAGTGMSDGGIDFRLDGKRQIVAWHPYHNYIRFTPEKPLEVGPHKVVITLTDRAGNTSTRSGTFAISK